MLASGGNDNKLFVWSLRTSNQLNKFAEHKAGVKAIAWNPHYHGLLVSGGGTADRTIRFWNTSIGKQVECIDVNS
jgi:cell division cycle 20-like protein 1, cofactor of APC complex